MEDVIRFLRQRGDSVVQSGAAAVGGGAAYVVNLNLELSAEQLIGRANAQRARLGQPPFAITPPAAAAPGAPPLLAASLPDRAA
jgi:hypothetical protein